MDLSHFSVSSNLCYLPDGSRLCQPARCELAEPLPGIPASPLCPAPAPGQLPGTPAAACQGSIPAAFQKSTLAPDAIRKGRLAQPTNVIWKVFSIPFSL